MEADMIEITTSETETETNTSRAVSVGRAILATFDERGLGLGAKIGVINDDDLDEAQWSEMVDYLNRRGVRIEHDHDGTIVARKLACGTMVTA
jgi:hypothetical protein